MARLRVPDITKKATKLDVCFSILRLIEANSNYSQRQMAQAAGLSLGSVNYCLKSLVSVGLVKVENFRCSDNKLRYAYFLTPQGAAEKAALTGAFLKRKRREYETLKAEIESLECDSRALNVCSFAGDR